MIGRTPAAQEDLSFDQFNSNLAAGESRIANDIIDKKTANETNNVHMYLGAGRDV